MNSIKTTIALMLTSIIGLTACSDKDAQSQQSSVHLSESSTKQDIVKAFVGTWSHCVPADPPEQTSTIATLTYEPNADFTELNIKKMTIDWYPTTDCKGPVIQSNEVDDGATVTINGWRKGATPVEGIGGDYLLVDITGHFHSSATSTNSTFILSTDGKKQADANKYQVVMVKQ